MDNDLRSNSIYLFSDIGMVYGLAWHAMYCDCEGKSEGIKERRIEIIILIFFQRFFFGNKLCMKKELN